MIPGAAHAASYGNSGQTQFADHSKRGYVDSREHRGDTGLARRWQLHLRGINSTLPDGTWGGGFTPDVDHNDVYRVHREQARSRKIARAIAQNGAADAGGGGYGSSSVAGGDNASLAGSMSSSHVSHLSRATETGSAYIASRLPSGAGDDDSEYAGNAAAARARVRADSDDAVLETSAGMASSVGGYGAYGIIGHGGSARATKSIARIRARDHEADNHDYDDAASLSGSVTGSLDGSLDGSFDGSFDGSLGLSTATSFDVSMASTNTAYNSTLAETTRTSTSLICVEHDGRDAWLRSAVDADEQSATIRPHMYDVRAAHEHRNVGGHVSSAIFGLSDVPRFSKAESVASVSSSVGSHRSAGRAWRREHASPTSHGSHGVERNSTSDVRHARADNPHAGWCTRANRKCQVSATQQLEPDSHVPAPDSPFHPSHPSSSSASPSALSPTRQSNAATRAVRRVLRPPSAGLVDAVASYTTSLEKIMRSDGAIVDRVRPAEHQSRWNSTTSLPSVSAAASILDDMTTPRALRGLKKKQQRK